MNLRKTIVDTFSSKVQKQNPWQPYTGPSGGQGWLNPITGEVRYQENRPAPDEGMPEDYEGEIPAPEDEEEIPDVLDPYEPTAEDYMEHVEPGMEISGAVAGTPYEGEVVDFYEGDKGVRIEMEDGSEAVMMWDEVDHPSAMEPPDGWAEGWEAAPNTTEPLEDRVGERVEVYDLETGQYVHGEIEDAFGSDDPDFTDGYVSVRTDEGDLVEITPGDEVGDDAVLTAIADQGGEPLEDLEEVGWDEIEDGDEVVAEIDDQNVFPEETYEATVDTESAGDGAQLIVETEDGEKYVQESHHAGIVDIFEEPTEFEPLEEVTMIDPSDPSGSDWGLLNGQEAVVETPIGEAEGSVDFVREDPEGHLWFSVGGVDGMEVNGFEVAEGDAVELEVASTSPGVDPTYYEGTFQGEYEGAATGDFQIETEDGTTMAFDEEDLADVESNAEEAMTVTTNPESPFYVGGAVQGVEDPFVEPSAGDEFKIGDQVMIDGEIEEVDGSNVEGGEVMLTDGEWYSYDELAEVSDEVATQDSVEPPHESPQSEWMSPVEIADDGSISMDPLGTGTYVYHHDEESGQMEISQVGDFSDGSEITLDTGETVHRANVEGYAHDTKQNVVEPGMLNVGESVTISEDGNEITGTVYDLNTHGTASVEIVDEAGNFHSAKPGYPGTAITGHDPDGGAYEPEAYEVNEHGDVVDSRPTEEVIEDLRGNIDFNDRDGEGRLEKGGPELAKQQKQALQEGLYRQFGVETVDDFYDMKAQWKGNSGSSPRAETLERAYKQAFGIQADHRHNGGGSPDDRLVKMAEAIGELSQEYFTEVFGDTQELARGSSSTAWGSFVEQFLADPTQDEYNLSFLANNNHTTDYRGTADKWNAFTAQHEVSSDDVLTMTDHLFETSYESELEIGVSGDEQTVSINGIHPGPQSRNGRPVGLSNDIEAWDSHITENFWQSMAQASNEIGYDSFGVGQLENLKRLVDHTDDIGASPSNAAQSELEKARGVLVDNAMPPEADDPMEALEFSDFEGLGDATDYEMGQGVPATAVDPAGQGTIEGEIMGTYAGSIMMWTEDQYGDPAETELEPDELVDVDEDALEDLQSQAALPTGDEMMDNYSPSIDDLDQLEEVYYTHGGDLKEGKVLSNDGNTVEVSGEHGQTEYFDQDEIGNGMVVSQEQVESAGEGGFDWMGVGSTDEIEPGEWIKLESGVHGEEEIVQVDHIDDGDVYPDSNSVDDFDPDPYYYPSEIDSVSPDPSGGDSEEPADPVDQDPFEAYEEDGFSEGSTVPVDAQHGAPGDDITMGDSIDIWDDAHGTVVDVTTDGNPKVYIEDAGGEVMHEAGDVIPVYPSDTNFSDGSDDAEETSDASMDPADLDVDPSTVQEFEAFDMIDPETGEESEFTVTSVDELDQEVTFYSTETNNDYTVPMNPDSGGSADPAYDENNPFEQIGVEQGQKVDVSGVNHPNASDLTGTVTGGEFSGSGNPLVTVEDDETGHPLTMTTDDDGNWVYPGGGEFEPVADPSDGAMTPDEAGPLDFGMGESIELETDGGVGEYEVTDPGMGASEPAELDGPDGGLYLLWPDGNLEEL